jgi:DNA-binding PadR family transcriptional regulator
MTWMSYRRPGALGMTRVRMTRARRRILLALLTGAANLYGWRLCEAAQVRSWVLYPFLDHLENAGWITGRFADVGEHEYRCYTLTDTGRWEASQILRLR